MQRLLLMEDQQSDASFRQPQVLQARSFRSTEEHVLQGWVGIRLASWVAEEEAFM